MSRDGSISLPLGGDEHRFRFGIAEHERVQEKLDMGVSLIVQNLHPYVSAVRAGLPLGRVLDAGMLGDVRREQIRAVILNGLVGGGMEPNDAGRLVKMWVDNRPLLEPAPLAYAIGIAALVGAEDEDAAGEPKGEGERLSPEANSGSAKTATTPSARRRASPPKTSAK